MTRFDDRYNKLIFLNPADDSVVPDAVTNMAGPFSGHHDT